MGKLILLTLPIGNDSDITSRALEALKVHEQFVVEDTRKFKDLLKRLGINYENKSIHSFHDHSSKAKAQKIIQELQSKEIVLASDAGSPYISDPAYPMVQLAIENDIEIETLPGVSSVNTALELSGLPPIPFHFWGFLPRDNKKNEVFQKLQTIKGTHLFFEGVSRVEQTLMELTKILPELSFCVARELTKTYQQVYRFKGANFDPKQLTYKGEFVICVYQDKENLGSNKLNSLAEEILSSGAKPKKVAALLSEILGLPSKEIYNQINRGQK